VAQDLEVYTSAIARFFAPKLQNVRVASMFSGRHPPMYYLSLVDGRNQRLLALTGHMLGSDACQIAASHRFLRGHAYLQPEDRAGRPAHVQGIGNARDSIKHANGNREGDPARPESREPRGKCVRLCLTLAKPYRQSGDQFFLSLFPLAYTKRAGLLASGILRVLELVLKSESQWTPCLFIYG
jgi:hypothetical protein